MLGYVASPIRYDHSTFIDPYYGKVYEASPTIKWNFSDKHDGTGEGFNVHDDQTPPCYVEKSADGTWSLTLTGVLADRQDLNPGNNWDYIETSGGTVYLKYKSWDAGGYWNGPYTRAQWSSSIGSETIRIYEHSSYSEPYNNGIYLIQQGEAFTNFPSTIAFTGWWNDQFSRWYELTSSTDTFIQYELYDANGLVGAEYGSTFTSTPSGILFNVDDVGDTSTPSYFSRNGSDVGTSGIVQPGDVIILFVGSIGSGSEEAVFTVPDFFSVSTYRTGTSQGFTFTSGSWKDNGYSAVLDDEANSSEGKLVDGVRQWEWDMPDVGGGRLSTGTAHWIHFVPGTTEDNGTWYRGTTAGTRSGRTISFGVNATFDETDAFVDGLVPYGDIP